MNLPCSAYEASGDLANGLKYKLEALEMRQEIYPSNHPDVAQSLNNVGSAYKALEDLENGLKYLLEALEMRQEIYTGNHPSVVDSLNNVGVAYQASGDLENSLKYFLKALEMRQKTYLGNHPNVAESLNNVGLAYCQLGQHAKSVEYLLKAYKIISHFDNHQHKSQIKQGLFMVVEVLVKDNSIDLICAFKLLEIILDYKLDFLDHNVHIDISSIFYNKNDLELGLATNQLALVFAENNENATDKEKQSILHNTGCLYNIMAKNAKKDNDKTKSNEYTLKAEESFQKALSYSSNSEDNAGLCAEYANFLVMQSKFKEAFEYLQKSVTSNNKTSGLQYGEIEKEVIVDIIKQSIENADKKQVTLNAREYAYYLLIANYREFISAGVEDIWDIKRYLEEFKEFCNNESKENYVSYLMLSDACKLCDLVDESDQYFAKALQLQMESQQSCNSLSDNEKNPALILLSTEEGQNIFQASGMSEEEFINLGQNHLGIDIEEFAVIVLGK